MRPRLFTALALVLLLLWLAPTAIQRLLRAGFYHFQVPVSVSGAALQDLQLYWSLRSRSKNELIAAGRDLARLRAARELESQQIQALRSELARLERLLDLPPSPLFHYEHARVLRRDLSAFWHQLTIAKGSRHGLAKGQGVVSTFGVVGRITEVYPSFATVELITSPTFRTAAHVEADTRPLVFQGSGLTPFSKPTARLEKLPSDLAPHGSPVRITASPLSGSFPPGLTLGTLSNAEPAPDGTFLRATIQLDPRLASLREVAILVPVSP